MARPPRKCIFCGESRLSREHVFGEWLREFFPRDKTTTHMMATLTWSDEIITRGPSKAFHRKHGHPGTRKVRVVCRACNNGWLSALEEQTKPILTPLIAGEHADLTPEAQTILATWSSKTVMTAEYVVPKKKCIPQVDRNWLKDRLAPPADWYVWIGTYNGSGWRDLAIYQHRGYIHASPIPGPGDKARYVQSTFFGVGHIVFLVINSAWHGIPAAFSNVEYRTRMFQIWPPLPRSILWPLTGILNDQQADAIAYILTKSDVFRTPPHR